MLLIESDKRCDIYIFAIKIKFDSVRAAGFFKTVKGMSLQTFPKLLNGTILLRNFICSS